MEVARPCNVSFCVKRKEREKSVQPTPARFWRPFFWKMKRKENILTKEIELLFDEKEMKVVNFKFGHEIRKILIHQVTRVGQRNTTESSTRVKPRPSDNRSVAQTTEPTMHSY